MDFLITFQNSGDSIPFRTTSNQTAEVLEYYVENLNRQDVNKFSSSVGATINGVINKLHSTIVECNTFITELLDHPIDTYSTENYLDQRNLNKLHADWVLSQKVKYDILNKKEQYRSEQSERIHEIFPDDIPTPTVGTILSNLGYIEQYSNINQAVHHLETLFRQLQFSVNRDNNWIEFPNPFSKSLLTNDICNFSLPFHHLGRDLQNKFFVWDHDLEFDDENTYNELLGYVDINLAPPQTIPLSKEYIAWCNKHDKIPSGSYFNIGNIPKLDENHFNYRKIIFKNTLQQDTFSIQLTKG